MGERRYRPREALPGVSAAGPGARLCLPAAAQRPPGAPGTRPGCAPRRAVSAMRSIESGAAPGKVVGVTDSGGYVRKQREMGWMCPGASSPSVPAGTGSCRSRGKRCWEEEKETKHRGGFMKNNQQKAAPGRFRFHFCFPLPQPYPPPHGSSRSPSALPPLRGRVSGHAASVSPGAGKRRGGSIPIPLRGNGAKFAVTFPCPLQRGGKWLRNWLSLPGTGLCCGAGGGLHGGKVTLTRWPGKSAEPSGPCALVPPRRPERSREAGRSRRSVPPRPGGGCAPSAAPVLCRRAVGCPPHTALPAPPLGGRSPPRSLRRDYISRHPAGRRAGALARGQ